MDCRVLCPGLFPTGCRDIDAGDDTGDDNDDVGESPIDLA